MSRAEDRGWRSAAKEWKAGLEARTHGEKEFGRRLLKRRGLIGKEKRRRERDQATVARANAVMSRWVGIDVVRGLESLTKGTPMMRGDAPCQSAGQFNWK